MLLHPRAIAQLLAWPGKQGAASIATEVTTEMEASLSPVSSINHGLHLLLLVSVRNVRLKEKRNEGRFGCSF